MRLTSWLRALRHHPRLEALEDRFLPSTFTVINTLDDTNPGSLRWAILQANSNPGLDTINFNIGGGGTQVITPTTPLPFVTDATIIDGTTQGGYAGLPLIELNGQAITVGPVDGLTVTGGSSTVTGLAVFGFPGSAITLTGQGGNLLTADDFGTNSASTAAADTGQGMNIDGSSNNTIGGSAAGAGNLIGNNSQDGLVLFNGASGNVVLGNSIGVNAAGTSALPNALNGIEINGAFANTVGGTGTGAGNVLSGNLHDGLILANASGNVVQGNSIGTNAAGTASVANNFQGVEINDANANTIGAANVISGNSQDGIILFNNASGNQVQGNRVGTTADGSAALPNSLNGVEILGASNNSIGPGNVLSGNLHDGIILANSATGNLVLGNSIGTDGTGKSSVANAFQGVEINGASSNTIGSGNLISGNTEDGVVLLNSAIANQVLGNSIGTDVTGMTALPNTLNGVELDGTSITGSILNTIGGSGTGQGNVLSGNLHDGILLAGSGTTGNLALGNFIGTNAVGSTAVANAFQGVEINGALTNTIGAAGAPNLISGNSDDGVVLLNIASGNLVLGNSIGTNASAASALANEDGIVILGTANNTIGSAAGGAGNLLSGNTHDGILLVGAGASGTVILGNFIGLGSGSNALGNGFQGVELNGAIGNTVGVAGAGNGISGNGQDGVVLFNGASGNMLLGNSLGFGPHPNGLIFATPNALNGVAILGTANNSVGAAGAGNLISGNGQFGVFVFGSSASGNVLLGNTIGAIDAGTTPQPNLLGGVNLDGTGPNTVGGPGGPGSNLISGNQAAGILINDGSSGILVQGNRIGPRADGQAALGGSSPQVNGVEIDASSGNTIGGTAMGAANQISGNGDVGIYLAGSGNVIQGNLIGTDPTGTFAVANAMDGIQNFLPIFGNPIIGNNTIGGTPAGAGNLISGNNLNGLNIGGTNNLIQGNKVGTDITGDRLLPNGGDGVLIGSNGNTVGGVAAGAGNLISGNAQNGLHIFAASGTLVLGNSIGTNAAGTAAQPNNQSGIEIIDASANTIGGTVAGAGNVISGNLFEGLTLSSGSANLVQGNLIGTNAAGTAALGNQGAGMDIGSGTGAPIDADANTIGGTTPGASNLISGNGSAGLLMFSSNNLVQGNKIGTDSTGSAALANGGDGVHIGTTFPIGPFPVSNGNTIGGTANGAANSIAFNGQAGVTVNSTSATGNLISANSIFSNAHLGIDLNSDGVTPNGVNPRSFPNNGQNFPVLTSATGTTVTGTLSSIPNTTFTLEFFSNVTADPSGFGQGQTFLGSGTVTTGADGNGSFTITLSMAVTPGQLVSATATDPNGNTSEFAQDITAT